VQFAHLPVKSGLNSTNRGISLRFCFQRLCLTRLDALQLMRVLTAALGAVSRQKNFVLDQAMLNVMN
jgi:hypothetical protein